jgi:cytochrome P450
MRADRYRLGADITVAQLDGDPHPVLAQLREHEPVSWLPALEGWLVTRYDFAVEVMRDAATYTVDDPRFSTGRVVGPSMLSLDGAEHARHRAPFIAPLRIGPVRERFEPAVLGEAGRLMADLRPAGRGELRRAFAGRLAVAIVTRALGLHRGEVPAVLAWYDAIVRTVTAYTAGEVPGTSGANAFAQLSARLTDVIGRADGGSVLAAAAATAGLTREQIIANAAVLLFGGIETTEGMIAGALLHLLERPALLQQVRGRPARLAAAVEESLRLEPAAAVIDRYATKNAVLGDAEIARGELVRVSIAGANRDPAVFTDPDSFDLGRANARRHLAFAHGPHVCVGVHLARLEANAGIGVLLQGLPGLRLDPEQRSAFRGLVFRKPASLYAVWD